MQEPNGNHDTLWQTIKQNGYKLVENKNQHVLYYFFFIYT